ncbi:hypothetical protein CLOBOL_03674 [Enterocloster bolteae ATCC BAA-613]|uniref:Uncharacterized protein n=1 Tax=Enterocloster bolteae (strain ATCC BAA-613 / DSM 15670 / CCUG 46953 / JCM 12243 / WAL 16351) TaxID=411902 RepID=A8RTH5_ENTBW|nr:hypothetical protein CLOBOL_03674 [Enterocloster bolteae ATCC BAA-613]
MNYIYKYFDLFAALFCVIITDKRKEGKFDLSKLVSFSHGFAE